MRRLDKLAAELASGRHGTLELLAEELATCAGTLGRLRATAHQGQAPAGTSERCQDLRRRIGSIREMLAHAEQVGAGLIGILALLYEAHRGSQYSASGAPELPSVPRLWAEG